MQQLTFGQIQLLDTAAFYRHLKDNDLLLEQIVFANNIRNVSSADQTRKDSLTLDIATAYFRLQLKDSCSANLKRITSWHQFSERKKQLYVSSLILCKEMSLAEKSTSLLSSPKSIAEARLSFSVLKRETVYTDSSIKDISEGMIDLRNRYVNTPRHSPFLAGTFSAILPGAGKWYIGYKQQALTAFIANILFAAQAAESYAKAGVSSPQFIITASLFGIFYSGNIWGSVLAAKKKKRDHLNEIEYEILDHYHTEFSKLSR